MKARGVNYTRIDATEIIFIAVGSLRSSYRYTEGIYMYYLNTIVIKDGVLCGHHPGVHLFQGVVWAQRLLGTPLPFLYCLLQAGINIGTLALETRSCRIIHNRRTSYQPSLQQLVWKSPIRYPQVVQDYFPTQKLLKMAPSRSSVENLPVISSRYC